MELGEAKDPITPIIGRMAGKQSSALFSGGELKDVLIMVWLAWGPYVAIRKVVCVSNDSFSRKGDLAEKMYSRPIAMIIAFHLILWMLGVY